MESEVERVYVYTFNNTFDDGFAAEVWGFVADADFS